MRIEKFISLIQENNSPEIKESAVVPENIHEIKALAKLGARVIGGGIGRVASSGTARKAGGFLSRNRPAKGMGSGIARGVSKFAGSGIGQNAFKSAGIEPKGGFFKTLGSEIKKNYGSGGKSLQKQVAGRYAGSEQNKDVDQAIRDQGVASGDKAREKIGQFKQAVGSQIDTTKKNIEQRRTDQAAAKAERQAAKDEIKAAKAKSREDEITTPTQLMAAGKKSRATQIRSKVLANIERSKEARLADPAMDRAMVKSATRTATRKAKEGMTDAERRDFSKISAYRAKHGRDALRKRALLDPKISTFMKRAGQKIATEKGRLVGNTGRDISNKGRYVGNQPRQT